MQKSVYRVILFCSKKDTLPVVKPRCLLVFKNTCKRVTNLSDRVNYVCHMTYFLRKEIGYYNLCKQMEICRATPSSDVWHYHHSNIYKITAQTRHIVTAVKCLHLSCQNIFARRRVEDKKSHVLA